MTNEAISAVLDHICNEARNFVHATFGAIELHRDGASVSALAEFPCPIESSGSDRLLRFIDDVRELTAVASPPPAPARVEDFDLLICAAGIVEALNLASRRRARHLVLDVPPGAPSNSLMITQDRSGVEEVLTRVLNTAFRLTRTSEVHLRLSTTREHSGAWSIVAARDEDLARKLIHWLNVDPAKVVLPDPDDVAVGIAIMVAGKRLRALGGSAELERDAVGHLSVAIYFPSRQRDEGGSALLHSEPDALNILVVEDCDESFVLSEVALQDENVSRANDSHEALSKIHKHRFDLVLMDIHLPGVNGYETIRNVRDWETETGNARTPIVVLSSDDLETQRRSAAQCGCSGFLRKPLHGADLIPLLDRLRQARVLL